MVQQLIFGIVFIICTLGFSGMFYKKWKLGQDALVISPTIVFLICAILSNMLAVLGVFTLTYIILLLLLIGLGMLIRFKTSIPRLMVKKGNLLIIAFFLLAVAVYALFENIPFGMGRDPSVYFLEGIHIARTKGIFFDGDPFIANNYKNLKNIIELSYSGLYSSFDYGLSNMPGDIVVQFLHLFPSLLALGYSLFGVKGILLINPIVALLSIGIIYIYVKRIFDKKTACIAAAFCAFNPAQIYSARVTQSEILGQLIFLLSIYFFSIGWNKKNTKIIALSGVLVGLTTFNRIDMYILGIGVYVLALYHIWLCPMNKKLVCIYCAGYSTTGVLALIYGLIFSYPYYKDHWDMKVLLYILLCNVILCFLVIASSYIKTKWFKNVELDIFKQISKNSKVLNLCFVTLLIIILFAYYLRPVYAIASGNLSETQRFNSNALRELCFYISFAAVLLAVYGLYSMMKNYETERWEQLMPFIFMGMSNALIYIYQPSIASDHIWASRRWITICIPFVLILAGYGVNCLTYKKIGKYVQTLTTLLVLAYMLYQSRGFLTQNIGGNILEEYKVFSEKLQDDKLYFCENKWVVTILRELFQKKNVLRLKGGYASYLSEYLDEESEAYIIGELPDSIKNNEQYSYKKVLDSYIYSSELERSRGRIPTEVQRVVVDTQIFCVTNFENRYKLETMDIDVYNSVPYIYDIQKFSSGTGTVAKNEVVVGKTVGYALYGPYATVPKGTYYVNANFETPVDSLDHIGYFEVSKNNGEVINRLEVKISDLQLIGNTYTLSLPFSLREDAKNIEYRFYAYGNASVKIKEISLIQISNIVIAGLDDTKNTNQLLRLKKQFPKATIAYLNASDESAVGLDYLSHQSGTESVENIYLGSIDSDKQDFLIASMDNDVWMKTLHSYNVVERAGDYLLLESKKKCKSNLDTEQVFKDGYTDLRFFCQTNDEMHITGNYADIYPGSYSLKMGFDFDVTSDTLVNLFDGTALLESEIHMSGNELLVEFETYKEIDNFFINVSDRDGMMLVPESIAIKQSENLEELIQRINLDPHFKIIKSIMDDRGAGDIVVIDEDSEINELIQKYDYVICPKLTDAVFEILSKEYVIINATNKYVLMMKEEDLPPDIIEKYKLKILSRNGYLMQDYFYDINQSTTTIDIPQGTYEFIIKITGNGKVGQKALNDYKMIIYDGDTIIQEETMTLDFSNEQEFLIPIMVSKEQEMKNIKVELVSSDFKHVQFCGIDQVRKISGDYIVNLNDMICALGEYTDDGIYLNSTSDSEIYGPYMNLQNGNYVVCVEYESSNENGLFFRVTADEGRQILHEGVKTEIETESKLNTKVMPFTVSDNMTGIEFYIRIPANTRFHLRKITIITDLKTKRNRSIE